MSTQLVFQVADFTPFTKIISADMNSRFQDIKDRFNWAGNTTTGLGDDNVQSNTVSGGGLTRATKLKLGTAGQVLINDGTGAMSSEATLSVTRGGSGLNIVIGSQNPGDVIQVNSTATAFEVSPPTAVSASLRVYQYLFF